MKITKLIYRSSVSRFFSLLIILTVLACCNSESEKSSAWEKFKPLNEIDSYIKGYYDASLGSGANPKSGNPGVYVDFSDGLVQAYSGNNQNLQIIQAITNKLVSPNVEWFKLGSSTIVKLDYSSNQLYNKVTDPSQYKDIMAPIKLSLEKITSSHNDALLITDFEEYTSDGKEQFENYPKEYFTKWLNAGNSITFFYTDYSETNKKSKITTNKHLYFTVFTHGQADANSMVTQIKDSFKGRIVTKTFELNNNLYKVSNNYGGKNNTGLSNKTFSQEKNYNFNGFTDKNLPYEVIGLNMPLDEKLDTYIQDIRDKGDGLFISKLTLNALDQSSFKLNQIGVKVYDVSDDYELFAQSFEAKKHTPKFTKDAEKKLVWDTKSKNDPVIVECYNTDKTSLKDKWIYKPQDLSSKILEEFLDVNKDLVAAHLKRDPGNIVLNTIFHSNFKLKKDYNPRALLRIDYLIDDASFNDSNPQLDDFKWDSGTAKGKSQEALKEAIRNTLQDPSINPKGKVIYTYFIKFQNESKSEK